MREKMLRYTALFIVVVVLIGGAGCGSGKQSQPVEETPQEQAPKGEAAGVSEKPIKVGMILGEVKDDGAWSQRHYEALLELKEKTGAQTMYAEAVPIPDGERVMRQMIAEGCNLVIATSYGYMDSVIKLAEEFPDVYFLHCSGYKQAPNVTTYWGRLYEAHYLAGIIMGHMTKSNKIGFVGAHPIPMVINVVNGFALGVKESNPEAKVYVVWTNSWTDAAAEKEAANSLLELGVDCFSMYQNTSSVIDTAAKAGAYAIGNHNDMSQWAPDAVLTSAMWNWTPYYVQAVNEIRDGKWSSTDWWWGIKEGAVTLAPVSDKVPQEVKGRVLNMLEEFKRGEANAFKGPIYSQDGTLKIREGEVASDQDLREMDWLVDNVVGGTK